MKAPPSRWLVKPKESKKENAPGDLVVQCAAICYALIASHASFSGTIKII